MWRWLSAEPGEVVDLAGSGTTAEVADDPHLGEELRRWRGIVARRRLVALLRRHAAVALALAALLEIVAQLGALPQWTVAAVPAALLVASVGFFAARGSSPFGLARLLDDELGLNDRLATALEIEARGEVATPLEALTVRDAAVLLRAGREDWHASAARGGRDWWAIAVPLAAIAVVFAIGSLASSGGPSGGSRLAAGPEASGAGGGPNEERRREGAAGDGRRRDSTPNGTPKDLGGNRPAPSSKADAEDGYRQIPRGEAERAREAGRSGEVGAAGGRGQTGRSSSRPGNGKPSGDESGAGEPGDGATKKRPAGGSGDQKEREESTVELGVEGQEGGSKIGGGAPTSGDPGAKGSSPRGPGAEAGAGAREGGAKGAPGGSREAGGERGDDTPGQATRLDGGTSKAVKIQPGYAPSRASKGGRGGRKSGDRQGGGGRARTGQVNGANQVGDEFTFVPATGGSAPAPATGLQQSYTEALRWIARLPW